MTKPLLFLILAAIAAGLNPAGGWAMLAPPGSEAPAYDRTADAKVIRAALESKLIKGRLAALGLTGKEIDSRLERLSDAEVHQLAMNIETLRPGGRLVLEDINKATLSSVVLIILIVLLILVII